MEEVKDSPWEAEGIISGSKISHSEFRDFHCVEESCLLGAELHRGQIFGGRKCVLVKCKIFNLNERVFCPG